MKNIKIFSDSSCDLPNCLLKEHDIELIPFYVSFDQETYLKEDKEITNEEFYHRLNAKKTFAKTSLPSVQDYINGLKPALRDGNDIICLCLTHKFSGSYQSACNAKHILEEQFHDRTIEIIDSIQATAGQGLVLLQIAYMNEAGLSIKEIIQRINIIKTTGRIMFTLDTLEYLMKGKRIGKVITLASNILSFKPLIQLKDGELIPSSNVRGRKKSLNKVLKMVSAHFKETRERFDDYDFCIVNATTKEDALFLQKELEQLISRKISYPTFQIGVTIGTYTGSGAIGISFIKKYDRITI